MIINDNTLNKTKKQNKQLLAAMQDEGELLLQVIKVYELWLRAMDGDWKIYFKYFAFTVDEHETDGDLRKLKPLINDAQDEEWIMPLLELIFEYNYDCLHIVKSRQQRISWILTHVYLYEGLVYANWLIILQSTKKINKADELFEKQQKAYNRLPPWKPKMRLNIRDGKASLANHTKYTMLGEDTDDSAGFAFNRFYFDEMSLHKKARKVVGTCLAGLGLGHEGAGNLRSSSSPRMGAYHVELAVDEFVESTRKWIIKRKWSKNGLSWGWNKRGHKVIHLHYSANSKKDAVWRAKEKPNYEEDTWEREFELNADAVEGDKVFRTFHIGMSKIKIPLIEGIPIIRGWDFGNTAAVIWAQYDYKAKIYRVIRELLQDYSDAPRLVLAVDDITNKLMTRGFSSYVMDWCDPYQGAQTDCISGATVMWNMEYEMGRVCKKRLRFKNVPRIHVKDRIEIMRSIITQGFIIDTLCAVALKGFRGGYVIKTGADVPDKKGVFHHLMDAMMYPAISIFNIHPTKGLLFFPNRLLPVVQSAPLPAGMPDNLEGIKIGTSR